jgi:signal transduction histidine kinase
VTAPVHRLLARQIKRATDASGQLDLRQLLQGVHEAYCEHERDLKRINRANALMSEELEEMFAVRERATAAELAKKAADTASAAKTQFLAHMSHELRTPLNAIIGYSEIIQDEVAESAPESIKLDADRILGAARHLLQLINEVLDFAKIEAHGVEIDPGEFDVRELLRDVIETMQPAAHANKIKLETYSASNIGSAFTDAFRVKQCLLNLLSNAIKFSVDGRVTLTAERTVVDGCDMLNLEVADTGIGMTDDQLRRAFTPFEQASAGHASTFGGTGLGLPITQGIAQALSGDITATSTPGLGSTFTLRIPVRVRQERQVRLSA